MNAKFIFLKKDGFLVNNPIQTKSNPENILNKTLPKLKIYENV